MLVRLSHNGARDVLSSRTDTTAHIDKLTYGFMELTGKQRELLHTQCPVCNESELSEMDSVGDDAPFLWCPNCESTIDVDGKTERGAWPKTERISYAELARRVGDIVLNNDLMSELAGEYDFELFTGEDTYCYKHETKEECAKDDSNCDYESIDVYQTYVISQASAEYLAEHTHEIVYHCDKLGLYLWGITHYGTGWDGVHTDVKAY